VKSGLSSDEIVRFAHGEIKSTHPPSRRISSTSVDFIGVCRFIPPVRVDLVEKVRRFCVGLFLVPVAGVEPAPCCQDWILSFPVASDHNGRKVVLEDGTSRRKIQSRQGKNAENRRKPLW